MTLISFHQCWHRVRFPLALLPATILLTLVYGWHNGYRVVEIPTNLWGGRDEAFYTARGCYTVPPFTDRKDRAREFCREHGLLQGSVGYNRRPESLSKCQSMVRYIVGVLLPTEIHVAEDTCVYSNGTHMVEYKHQRVHTGSLVMQNAYKWGVFWIGDPGTLYMLTCSEEDANLMRSDAICGPCEEIIGAEVQPE